MNPEPPQDPLIGTRLGGYVIEALLGKGAMGAVYRAVQVSLNRHVALKVMAGHLVGSEESAARFWREARAAAAINHPNLVQVYDFGEANGIYFYAMELVDGLSLGAYLRRGDRFTEREVIEVGREVTLALRAAHRAGVIHRDLKPDNLMLTSEGVVKVADLGMARFVTEAEEEVAGREVSPGGAGSTRSWDSLTMTGMGMGTPAFMSPEQIRAEKDLDHRSDFYALGSTLFQLATGRVPFPADSADEVMQMHLSAPVPRAREVMPGLGDEFSGLIARLMAKSPEDRPRSHEEILAALERCRRVLRAEDLVSESTLVGRARVRGSKERSRPWHARSLAWVAVAGLVGLAGVGSWHWGMTQLRQTEAARRIEDARKGQERITGARGGLLVRTEPDGAMVSVDGGEQRPGPAAFSDLRPGSHRVAVRLEGFASKDVEVVVLEGKVAEVGPVVLDALPGRVRVSSEPPGAEVMVSGDGRGLGMTPTDIELPGGRHELTFSNAGWPEKRVAVDVVAGTNVKAKAIFGFGAVRVESDPPGAEMWRAGKKIGATPMDLADVMPGKLDLELRMAGWRNEALSGVVEEGKTLKLESKLRAEPPASATRERPFVNSLGMRFVPIEGTRVLFSIWETRVRDFEAFVSATGHDATQGAWTLGPEGWRQCGGSWKSPGFVQTGIHPACCVSWEDAKAFCRWLTAKERGEGRLDDAQEYRLPTGSEWKRAVTFGTEGVAAEKVYPWGTQWPPPTAAGNLPGEEARDADWPPEYPVIAGYRDVYAHTAPVGSFSANGHGLYDLGGNIREWCEDATKAGVNRLTLGASCFVYDANDVLDASFQSYWHWGRPPESRHGMFGFRCVLVTSSVIAATSGAIDSNAPLTSVPAPPATASAALSPQPTARAAGVLSALALPVLFATKESPFVNSLGMRFVPVAGTKVLFSIWETRVKDFGAFVRESGYAWQAKAGYEQGPDHPVVMVSWEDAKAFCAWLGNKEGREYRLPTDEEWDAAVGQEEFPWGKEWPPPPGVDNLAGEESKLGQRGDPQDKNIIKGYRDKHPRTAPVGSYGPLKSGLHDMAGNVREFCEDWYTEGIHRKCKAGGGAPPEYNSDEIRKGNIRKVLRGGSWDFSTREALRSSYRSPHLPARRHNYHGFRCVLVVSPKRGPAAATPPPPVGLPPRPDEGEARKPPPPVEASSRARKLANVRVLKGHTGPVHCVAFTPDGRRIVSGSSDCTVRVWDVAGACQADCLQGQQVTINHVAVSSDGDRVVSCNAWGELVLWDLVKRREIARLKTHGKDPDGWRKALFSPNGDRVFFNGFFEKPPGNNGGGIAVWEVTGRREREQLFTFDVWTGGVACCPDGKHVAAGHWNGGIRLMNIPAKREVWNARGHQQPITYLSFSGDGKRLASACWDGSARVWDVSDGTEIFCGSGQGCWVLSVALSPDGKWLVSGGTDCADSKRATAVHLWDVERRKEVAQDKHEDGVKSVAFSADGRYGASGSLDGTIHLWELPK